MKDGLKYIVGKTKSAEVGTRAPESLASRMKRDLDAWNAAKAIVAAARRSSKT